MAVSVMVAENPETVYIFLPYEIIEVDTVGDNLFIKCPHWRYDCLTTDTYSVCIWLDLGLFGYFQVTIVSR